MCMSWWNETEQRATLRGTAKEGLRPCGQCWGEVIWGEKDEQYHGGHFTLHGSRVKGQRDHGLCYFGSLPLNPNCVCC